MTFKKWEIVLVPFPFTNQKKSKQRPALIISPDDYNKLGNDVIIVFMTSNLAGPERFGDYTLKNWKKSSLPKPTMIRMKFATILSSIIVKKLGTLQSGDISGFSNNLKSFLLA